MVRRRHRRRAVSAARGLSFLGRDACGRTFRGIIRAPRGARIRAPRASRRAPPRARSARGRRAPLRRRRRVRRRVRIPPRHDSVRLGDPRPRRPPRRRALAAPPRAHLGRRARARARGGRLAVLGDAQPAPD